MEITDCKIGEEIKKEVSEIKKLLMGNGVIGIAEMARRSFEYMQHSKSTKNGLLDWSFRAFITILIGFVAYKIGLTK